MPLRLSKEPDIIALEENADDDIVAGNIEGYYLGFHAKRPIFFPDFQQIWIFLTDINKTPQYRISRKFI
jgi:muramoyltetrapeptide carboxypeptidase LdcA involved in peptidoglycan recycling